MTQHPLRLVVAINPAASFGARRRSGTDVVRTLRAAGHDVTQLIEPDLLSLTDAVEEALTSRPDALIVVGGDGMVHLGVNLLADSDIPLGIVPSGTGNDNARGLGIPIGDTDAATRHLLERLAHPPRRVDAGRIEFPDGDSSWFLGVLSAGLDAAANERANRMRYPRGKSRYTIALLRELATLAPRHYRLELDGVITERDGILVAVANNVSIGGGMRVAPDASLDDGLFDVVVLDPVNRRQLIGIFPSVFSGAHIHDRRVSVQRARRVTIDVAEVVGYADGERIGPFPLTVEVVPAALRVLA